MVGVRAQALQGEAPDLGRPLSSCLVAKEVVITFATDRQFSAVADTASSMLVYG